MKTITLAILIQVVLAVDSAADASSACAGRGEWLARTTHVVVGRTLEISERKLAQSAELVEVRVAMNVVRSLGDNVPNRLEFVHYVVHHEPMVGRDQSSAPSIGRAGLFFLRRTTDGSFRSVCDYQRPFVRLPRFDHQVPSSGKKEVPVVQVLLAVLEGSEPDERVLRLREVLQVYGTTEVVLALRAITEGTGMDVYCLAALELLPGFGFRCSNGGSSSGTPAMILETRDKDTESILEGLLRRADWRGLATYGATRDPERAARFVEMLRSHPNQAVAAAATALIRKQ